MKSFALNAEYVPRSVCFQLFKFEIKLCTIITVFGSILLSWKETKFCEAFACARSFCKKCRVSEKQRLLISNTYSFCVSCITNVFSFSVLVRFLAEYFQGIFPRDNPRNTRFSINFFTSIGLGGVTYVSAYMYFTLC